MDENGEEDFYFGAWLKATDAGNRKKNIGESSESNGDQRCSIFGSGAVRRVD